MYKTIIFDLDDTLTNDFENTKEAFKIVMQTINEEYTDEKFLKFYKIDKQTWADRAAGKLPTPYENDKEKKAEWIRAYRFLKYFESGVSYEEAVHINNIYMNAMKEKVVAREGCYEIIKYLHEKKYRLIIATNGPIIPLKVKLQKLHIMNFIDTIFSAEEVGFMKPHDVFYKGLFEKAKITTIKEILFIGDDLEKDVKGAVENSIDICWCNYKNEVNNKYKIDYEIHNLKELEEIL